MRQQRGGGCHMIPLTGLSFWEEIKKTELGYPRPSHSRILGLVLFCATIGKKYFFVQRQLEREKKKNFLRGPAREQRQKRSGSVWVPCLYQGRLGAQARDTYCINGVLALETHETNFPHQLNRSSRHFLSPFCTQHDLSALNIIS